jgi:hypothetical protein
LALALALAKELSGEAHVERAQQMASACRCAQPGCVGSLDASAPIVDLLGEGRDTEPGKIQQRVYVEAVEQRFSKVKRCC